MPIAEVVAAAVIAGIGMAVATEAGYRLGIVRGNLLRVDGEFALNRLGVKADLSRAYAFGIAVHLVTSAVFGAFLYAISEIADVDPSAFKVVAPYVFVLWLAMLFSALPVAGQGILGRKLGDSIWLEQLVLHVIFFFGLWGMLSLF